MSVEDEKRQISELVIRFIDLVDFNFDFQQMLSFYGDARAAFTNLDPVLAHLVQVYRASLVCQCWHSDQNIFFSNSLSTDLAPARVV